VLAIFGDIGADLEGAFLRSLRGFFASIEQETGIIPSIPLHHYPLPEHIPSTSQEDAFFDAMEHIPGNIILGATDTGFYDPPMGRFIFGTGRRSMGALSTHRFRTETSARSLYLERMNKEIIKILGMACGLSSCRNPDCIMEYHRTMQDVDRNRLVCRRCREKFVEAITRIMRDPDGKP
jgi:predicted Zn-dependent protease